MGGRDICAPCDCGLPPEVSRLRAALARLHAELTQLQTINEDHVEDRMVKTGEILKLRADLAVALESQQAMIESNTTNYDGRITAEAALARLQAERDNACGELGFTKNDLRNAIYRAEKAEAEVARLHAERDEGIMATCRVIYDRFVQDEADGYLSRDRQYAIELLKRHMKSKQ